MWRELSYDIFNDPTLRIEYGNWGRHWRSISYFTKENFQIWKSPHGGTLACLFAERVAANPWNINMGLVVSGSAQVPADYRFVGSLVPNVCSAKVLMISCIGLGLLIGAAYAYNKPVKKEQPL